MATALSLALGAVPGAAATAPVYLQAAHSGTFFGATSTTSAGGGAYEDVTLSTTPGQVVCASAWVRTQYPSTGASGSFVVWLTGGGASEAGKAQYAGLGNLGNWAQVQTCAEATASHTGLRIQFYPTPGSPTVDMDDVDVHRSLAVDGGFEQGGAWHVYPGTGSNFSDYGAASGAAARSGSHFGATNATDAGGGIYEDVALNTSPGQVVCASAWVRTEGAATGASGSLVVWLRGSGASDAGKAQYAGLGNGGEWTEVQTCAEATASHTGLRIQFYPTPGSPTVEIDDVDVHRSLAVDGGFEQGGAWHVYPGTGSNFSDYGAASGAAARSGSHFGATNATDAGGGIYEDVALNTSPGQVVCASAWVRTEGAATGASGSLVVWLRGSGASDAGKAQYAGLGNGGEWTEVQTCAEATASHTGLRIQFYPTPGSPTVEIDDVDVHQSLAANGGFEYGSGPWGTYPNTISAYDAEPAGEVVGPTPVVTQPVATTLPRPRGRHALRIRLSLSWTWRYAVTRLDRATAGTMPGRTRITLACAGRGCPRHSTMSATGARRVRRLLKSLHGRRYRAKDVLRITLSARGYRAERAQITFRVGRLPVARLLSR